MYRQAKWAFVCANEKHRMGLHLFLLPLWNIMKYVESYHFMLASTSVIRHLIITVYHFYLWELLFSTVKNEEIAIKPQVLWNNVWSENNFRSFERCSLFRMLARLLANWWYHNNEFICQSQTLDMLFFAVYMICISILTYWWENTIHFDI